MAVRVEAGKGKKEKDISKDLRRARFDVLNFHMVFRLPTGPFVACEAVIVDRTASTFESILFDYRRRLAHHGDDTHFIKYFVCDMALPFAHAVIKVFNGISLPEYVAHLCYSAKHGYGGQNLFKTLDTLLVWCGVHGDRAMIRFAVEVTKGHVQERQKEIGLCLRNIRMALASAKTYDELCELIGFLDLLSSSVTFFALLEGLEGKVKRVATSGELLSRGESILWEHIGGVPTTRDSADVLEVRRNAGKLKGYVSYLAEDAEAGQHHVETPLERSIQIIQEVSHGLPPIEEEFTEDNSSSPNSGRFQDRGQRSRVIPQNNSDAELENSISEVEKGVYLYLYGSFHVYIVFREKMISTNLSRYRVYIPSLSLIQGTIGGFNVYCEDLKAEARINNSIFLDGRTNKYLRKRWFPNVAMFSQALIGDTPLSDNSTVEISFKVKKHHTDLGINAMHRSGGMNMAEYVKRTSKSSDDEAIRQALLLA